MRSRTVILLLILAGFFLRLLYATTSHPFFDEYTTVLAARQILRHGWPVLPSGLFYEHGLLSTYLITPFAALFVNTPPADWQPAQWGLMPARWPSVLLGTATIPLIYRLGQSLSLPPARVSGGRKTVRVIALLAAGLFAISPEGMVWGGRARMYALAAFLVLLTVYLAFRGAMHPAPARFRWAALAVLLATLLTQLGALLLIPPLLAAMLALGWWSRKQAGAPGFRIRLLPTVLPELAALGGVVGLALLVKRLGQPLGAAQLGTGGSGSVITELIQTVAYQTTLYFTVPDTIKFLARQFGVTHHLWLAAIAVAALAAGLLLAAPARKSSPLPLRPGNVFLWLVFGLMMLEVVTLLEPFRRNPRYITMYLPLFYLLAANGLIFWLALLPGAALRRWLVSPAASLALTALALLIGWDDLQVARLTPEPAYEQAFSVVAAGRRPGDALLTMNTPAAELYLGGADGFTVQSAADQFLLNATSAPVDRWLGAPWLGSAADFSAALNAAPRAWFVIDTVRLPVYFRGDWQAVLNSQMEQVWAGDNALVYRTRASRVPLPTAPNSQINANFGDKIQLVGVALDQSRLNGPAPELGVTFFWQSLAPVNADYTVFLHLRNSDGATVAQRDGRPLNGDYPTQNWQPGESVLDPVTLPLPADLPARRYTLLAGLYRLDTLERLPLRGDTSGENAAVIGEIELPQ